MKLRVFVLMFCLGLATVSFAQTKLVPTSSPQPGIYLYNMKMNMQGQDMEFVIEREVKEEGENILLNDKTATPFGTSESVTIVKKGTLLPISMESTGFAGMKLNYGEDKITGEVSNMQGNKSPIDVAKTGPVYNETVIVSYLPLAEGYTTSFQAFNTWVRKVVIMDLKVVGKEKIEVAAGTFDTYKVELTSAALGTLVINNWVSTTDPKMVVKSETNIPQGGKIILEYTGVKEAKKEKKAKK